MLFYIQYKQTFDDTLFKLWLNHYLVLKIDYGIYVEDRDFLHFTIHYPFAKNIIDSVPKNTLLLTEMDFLMSYTVNEDDIMILSYTVDENELLRENTTIGRVFYVPIQSKTLYTAFEIPDFIIYKHNNHTNFTKDGITLGKKENPSVSTCLVSLNMNPSKVAYEQEYYETNIIINTCSINTKENLFFTNVYTRILKNVFVNKEKKYGIIWHPKCGCTTISDIFCYVNNIPFNKKDALHLSLSWKYNKYRYNVYLQNIDTISFVRNPYERFISSYIDKHVFKNESTYLSFEGYNAFVKTGQDTLYNLYTFLLSGEYITNHYVPISEYNKDVFYYSTLQKNYVKIEDGLNEQLYEFLKKYHPYLRSEDILDYFTNTNVYKREQHKPRNTDKDIFTKLKYFTSDEWLEYLSKYELNYSDIIENDLEFKNLLYKMYEKDFLELKYFN